MARSMSRKVALSSAESSAAVGLALAWGVLLGPKTGLINQIWHSIGSIHHQMEAVQLI